jgi:hypothetical protein
MREREEVVSSIAHEFDVERLMHQGGKDQLAMPLALRGSTSHVVARRA